MASLASARDEFWINGKYYPRRTINDIDMYCLNKDELFCVFYYLNFCDFEILCLVNKEFNKYIKEYFKHYNTNKYKFENKIRDVKLNSHSNIVHNMIYNSNYDSWVKKNILTIKKVYRSLFCNVTIDTLNLNCTHTNTIYYFLEKCKMPSFYLVTDIVFITYLIMNQGLKFIRMKKKYKLEKTDIQKWKDIESIHNKVINIINEMHNENINKLRYICYRNNINKILSYNQCVAFTLYYFNNNLKYHINIRQRHNFNKKILKYPEIKSFLDTTLVK